MERPSTRKPEISPRTADTPPPNGPSRRRLLQSSALLTAGVLATPKAMAQGTISLGNSHGPSSSLRPLDANYWLLNRASFGFAESDYITVRNMGIEGWVDWQLDPFNIPDPLTDTVLGDYPWRADTAMQMLEHPSMDPWEFANSLQQMRTIRAVLSKRQLHERLTEFWTDHFNVYGFQDPILKTVGDRDIIRALGMGRFSDLLRATAKDGAMLEYLDNANNTDTAPNENYAREVMELHTLGVDGPYTELDVQELARCFTGWDYVSAWQAQNNGGIYGEFDFRDWKHDDGPKVVLGQNIPAGGGLSDGEIMLDYLAGHPATAQHVCKKLCRWFLGYDVPSVVVDRAVATWTQTDGLIREVVRSILTPQNIRDSKPWENPKVKRPHHWLASLLRSLGNSQFLANHLVWNTFLLGQPLFERHSPDGYPDSAFVWASSLQPRWDFSSMVGHGWLWSVGMDGEDFRTILHGQPKSQWIAYLNQELLGGQLSDFELDQCQRYLDLVFSTDSDQAVGEAFELIFSCPTFQLY